jgi:hypothetical protein
MIRRAALAAITVMALSAHAALALQPGVFVEPNSPAGKEYARYTTGARSQGAGTPQPGLFGAGITPPGATRAPGPQAGSLWIGTTWIPWVILAVLVPSGVAALGAFLTRRARGSAPPVPGSPQRR